MLSIGVLNILPGVTSVERRKFNIKSKYFSFDKIVLTFDENETVKISPKEEQDFIKHLLSINPNIDVKIQTAS